MLKSIQSTDLIARALAQSSNEDNSFQSCWSESQQQEINYHYASLFEALIKKETNAIHQIREIKDSYQGDNIDNLQKLMQENNKLIDSFNTDIIWDIVKKGYVKTWSYLISNPEVRQKLQAMYDKSVSNLLATALLAEQQEMFLLLMQPGGLDLNLVNNNTMHIQMTPAHQYDLIGKSLKITNISGTSEISHIVSLNSIDYMTRFIFNCAQYCTDSYMQEHLRLELLNRFPQGFNALSKIRLHDSLMQNLPQQDTHDVTNKV
jgi:hypothetical protein